MALTSIFLSILRLVKEYKYNIFKDLKLINKGQVYYYTEVTFPEIDKWSRIDGLIIVVIKWIIKDAIFLEMKNKNNVVSEKQIEKYIDISKKLWIWKIATISNQFVPDPSHSPIKIKTPKSISLLHFSWTYLLTKGQLLLFKNNNNIKDEDQVEIMKEFLYYMEDPLSGVSEYTQMKPCWKELVENVQAKKILKVSDVCIENSIISWYEEEKNIALLMSRKLWILVKSSFKWKDALNNDIKDFVKKNYIKWLLSIKNSVSDIKIIVDFERRWISMSVKVIPPLNKWTVARITWVSKQFEKCREKKENIFKHIENNIWVETNIKYAKDNLKVKLSELDTLPILTKWKEIQEFHIVLIKDFGVGFASTKKFIENIERMILEYYEWLVQYMTSWDAPTPKLDEVAEINWLNSH